MAKIRFVFKTHTTLDVASLWYEFSDHLEPADLNDADVQNIRDSLQHQKINIDVNGQRLASELELVTSAGNHVITTPSYDVNLTGDLEKVHVTVLTKNVQDDWDDFLFLASQDHSYANTAKTMIEQQGFTLSLANIVELQQVQISEDNGATWRNFNYNHYYAYLMNEHNDVSLMTRMDNNPGTPRSKVMISDIGWAQNQVPYLISNAPFFKDDYFDFNITALVSYQADLTSDQLNDASVGVPDHTVISVFA